MESEAAATCPVGGDGPFFTTASPLDLQSFFAQIPEDCNMEDLLRLDVSAGPAPSDLLQFAADDTSHSTVAGLRQAVQLHPVGLAGATVGTGVEDQREQNAHACFDFDWTGTGLGLITGQPATYSVVNPGPLIGTGIAEIPHSRSHLWGFNLEEINTVLNPIAAVKDILSAENPPQEPSPLVVNAGLAMPEPDPCSTGDSSCCPSTTADMGISSSPDLQVNAEAALPQSGGGVVTEAAVRGSSKRKKLVCGSSSQRSTLPEFVREESVEDVLYQRDPSSTDIKPRTGSTDEEIIRFISWESSMRQFGEVVNFSLGEQDQICPKAVRSYVTTVEMMPDQKAHLGYWKEKQAKLVNDDFLCRGLIRTFQFHKYDGTKTDWFMDEHNSLRDWGIDRYVERLRFRKVYKSEEITGEGKPTYPEGKINSKSAAVKKHRMRGPENMVIKGESPAWKHFIKIYDKDPELEGSKIVYAVCCHCHVVLKAGTENGTKSLLTHCDRTCPVKNKKQQPISSSPYSTLAAARLPHSGSGGGGGYALAEIPVRASCKRKRLVCGSSSQRSTLPEFNLVELLAGLVQSDPSSTDIKPPTGSTDIGIIRFLKREESSMPRGKEVNLSLGEQDQMAPEAARGYVTTVKMMPDQNTHDLGYWNEKQVKHLREDEPDGIVWSFCRGLKRTFQFHMNDGTKTNWFMHEYVPTDLWGRDLFMKPLRFREVYEGAEVPGEPTSPEGKIKNKISAAKKHRMRGPENMVIKGESRAWQHFIKIYDEHPELEGSKVVYALCCHCEGVLKAGADNGTKSLLTHCDRTCPAKNKKQQPSSSSYEENFCGVLVGVGIP